MNLETFIGIDSSWIDTCLSQAHEIITQMLFIGAIFTMVGIVLGIICIFVAKKPNRTDLFNDIMFFMFIASVTIILAGILGILTQGYELYILNNYPETYILNRLGA